MQALPPVYQEPEPRLFSFNNPFGACPRCQGFGNTIDFDLDLIIPDKSKTLDEGAIDPWTAEVPAVVHGVEEARRSRMAFRWMCRGTTSRRSSRSLFCDGDRRHFSAFAASSQHLERKKYKLHVRVFLSQYRGYALCPECSGQRLRAEARAVQDLPAARTSARCRALTIGEAQAFFDALELTPTQQEIAGRFWKKFGSGCVF